MTDQGYFEQIDAYLSGAMNEDQRLAFEAELTRNADLQQEFQLYENAAETAKLLRYDALKERITSIESAAEEVSSSKHRPSTRLSWARIAASVLFILGASSIFVANRKYCDPCLVDHSAFDLFSSTTRGQEIPDTAYLQRVEAVKASIAAEQVEEALEQLSEMETWPNTDQVEIQFLKVQAAIARETYDSARQWLVELQSHTTDVIRETADWEIVQVYLLTEKTDKAKQEIRRIASNAKHSYQPRARHLLDRLNSPFRKLVFQ